MIFSIGKTSTPSAPASLTLSITSQNSFSFTTECMETHPSFANGVIEGLFTPGIKEEILLTSSFLQRNSVSTDQSEVVLAFKHVTSTLPDLIERFSSLGQYGAS